MSSEARQQEGPKLGIVLSGGGGRGAFEAGVMQRLSLDARFRNPQLVAGTSAGAINAALFASGYSPEAIRDFWLDLGSARTGRTNDSFFSELILRSLPLLSSAPWRTLLLRAREHLGLGAPLSNLVEALLTDRFDLVRRFLNSVEATHVIDTRRLRAHLMDCFGGPVVPIRRCDLAINAVDARTNSVVRFVTRATERTQGSEYVVTDQITVDMVLASTSIPLLFPSIPLGRRLLWDGGVLSNTPLAPAVALGADQIVIVLVNHNDELAHPRFDNLGQALERLVDMLLENAYNVDRQLLLSRNRIAQLEAEQAKAGTAYREVRLYQAIRPARDAAFDAGSLIDFDRARLRHLYAQGQSAAAAWLRSGPPIDGPWTPTVALSTDREPVASPREATA